MGFQPMYHRQDADATKSDAYGLLQIRISRLSVLPTTLAWPQYDQAAPVLHPRLTPRRSKWLRFHLTRN
jgi:hypothetical protein